MFKQVHELKNKMAKMQEIMEKITVTAEAGGGLVKVTATGNQRISNIELDPEIVDTDDMEMLHDLIVAGVNKALEKAAEAGGNELRTHAESLLPNFSDPSDTGS
ncbi:MAG: YbaB/EbfC family nucleoid-associated protein [Bacteroidetes bacterium]|nr:YbaB/EbfC family nucleoid-associated protein [Bacteroidota bacterium]MCY4232273.1 YbaB/EbfC family nucleoid-associated protein [Bacteroidota bacterium]